MLCQVDKEFYFNNSYKKQKLGAAGYRSQQQSLAKRFKKDLIEKGFEEELFGDQMERRLYHASGHNDKQARAEVLFSPFYSSKYPAIKTFNDSNLFSEFSNKSFS